MKFQFCLIFLITVYIYEIESQRSAEIFSRTHSLISDYENHLQRYRYQPRYEHRVRELERELQLIRELEGTINPFERTDTLDYGLIESRLIQHENRLQEIIF